MNEPIYAWSDALNRKVLVGISLWNGRDGLLPDRPQQTPLHLRRPEGPLGRARARVGNALPSQTEMGDGHNHGPKSLRGRCGCGRSCARHAKRCLVCARANQSVRRRKAA